MLSFANETDGIGFKIQTNDRFEKYYGFENIEQDLLHSLNQYNPNADLIFLFGIGIGYEIEQIMNTVKKNTAIIVIDYDETFKFAIETNENLQSIIKTNNNIELISLNKRINSEVARYIIMKHYWRFTKEVNTITLRYFPLISKQSPHEIQNIIFDAWKLMFFNSGNDLIDGLIGISNNLENIKNYKSTISFNKIKEFKNIPAVCVASGPSVSKQIPLLKKIKDKVIIIAADSIYEALRKEDIIADIITVQERGEVIFDLFFKDKIISDKTVLLAQSVVDPKVFKACENRMVAFKNLEYEKQINNSLGLENVIFNGGSCANLSPAIAEKLGCNPIILIGQDLAFSDSGESHAPTSTSIRTNLDVNTKEEFRKPKKTLGWYGNETVYTTEIWDSFKVKFSEFSSIYSNDFLNCTEGGSYIENWLHLTFEDAINKYKIYSLPKLSNRPVDLVLEHSLKNMNETQDYSSIIKRLTDLINENNQVLEWLKFRYENLNEFIIKYENNHLVSEKDNTYVQRILEDHDEYLSKNTLSTLLYGPLRYTYHRKILEHSEINSGKDFSKLCNIIGLFLYATHEAYTKANYYIEEAIFNFESKDLEV